MRLTPRKPKLEKTKAGQSNISIPISIMPLPFPAEILFIVFHFVQVDRPPPRTTSPFFPELQWIPEVTYTCRHWRLVALSDPTLWSQIHLLASWRWAKEFRQRSKGCTSISVRADFGEKWVRENWLPAGRKAPRKHPKMDLQFQRTFFPGFDTLDRIEAVTFANATAEQVQHFLVNDNPNRTALRLKRLSLSGKPDLAPYSIRATHDNTLAKSIFDPTHLHLLQVRRGNFRWDFIGHCPQLTHLIIDRPMEWLAEDLDILRVSVKNMACLQVLFLDFGPKFDGFGQNTAEGDDEVVLSRDGRPTANELPNLRSINIRFPTPLWIWSLLRTIAPADPPSGRKVDITTIDLAPASNHIQQLFASILYDCPGDALAFIRIQFFEELADGHIPHQGVLITHGSLSEGETVGNPSSDFQYRPNISHRFEPKLPQKALNALKLVCQSATYYRLRHLELVNFLRFPSPEEFATTVGQLPQLHSITFKKQGKHARFVLFFAALIFGVEDGTAVYHWDTPFKALQSIYMHTGPQSLPYRVEKSIRKTMTTRRSLGFPILNLELPTEQFRAYRNIETLELEVASVRIVDT